MTTPHRQLPWHSALSYRSALSARSTYMVFVGLLCILLPLSSQAVYRDLARGGNICSVTEDVCMSGSVVWRKNSKLVEIRGRLRRPSPKGTMTFWFSGFQGSGAQVFVDTQVPVRGKRNEIIDKTIRLPYSNQTIWSLERVTFRESGEQSPNYHRINAR